MSRPKGYAPGPLTSTDQAYIIGNYKQVPMKKMAAHLRRGYRIILRFLAENNLGRYIPEKKRSLSPEQVDYILHNYHNTPVWRMSVQIRTSTHKVQAILSKHGLQEYYVRNKPVIRENTFFNCNQSVY